jgi:predicted nucleic acid-binding protein
VTTYIDSSVVLRVLFDESNRLAGWADHDPISSELLRVECLRVIDRARLNGLADERAADLRADAIDLILRIPLVAVTGRLLERAAEPFPTMLRTLDALHLATALALREDYPDVTLATHDRELGAAARAVGFTVTGI